MRNTINNMDNTPTKAFSNSALSSIMIKLYTDFSSFDNDNTLEIANPSDKKINIILSWSSKGYVTSTKITLT